MSCACAIDPAAPFALDYYVGDTVGILATITLDGAAYDLTDCALRFTVTDTSASPATTLWDRAIGSGIAIISLTGGTALITPTLTQSQALTAGRTYTARAVLTDSSGATITTATGYLRAL